MSDCQKPWNSGIQSHLQAKGGFTHRKSLGMNHFVDHTVKPTHPITLQTGRIMFTTPSPHVPASSHAQARTQAPNAMRNSVYPFFKSQSKTPEVVMSEHPVSFRKAVQSQKTVLSNRINTSKNHVIPNERHAETGWVVINHGEQLQHNKNTGISRNINRFFRRNQNIVSMIKPAQGRSRNTPKKEIRPPKTSNTEHRHAHGSAPFKMHQRSNLQMNAFHPLQRIRKKFSPYDKIQSALVHIKNEVHNQRGMIGLLQKSIDKMKHIFSTMQGDIQKLVNSVDVLVKMQ